MEKKSKKTVEKTVSCKLSISEYKLFCKKMAETKFTQSELLNDATLSQ
jgi:hypothetical protein